MQFLLSFVLLVALAQGQDAVKTYPVVRDGVQFINMGKPALSKLSNLFYDPGMNPPAIWFTADKSNPNIFLTRLSEGAAPYDWWFESGNTFQPLTSPPFLSIDVNGGLIAGCALPSAANNANAYDAALQATLYSGKKNQSGSDPFNYPGYSFYSIIRSTTNKAPSGNWFAYVTGWAEDGVLNNTGFFVARVEIGAGPTPDVIFDPEKDLIDGFTKANCYDLFTTVKKPLMFLDEDKPDPNDETFLFVVIPGRCSEIVKVVLGDNDKPFNTVGVPETLVVTTKDQFIASAVRDPIANRMYLAISPYSRVTPTNIISVELYTTPMNRTNEPVMALETGGIDQVMMTISADSPNNKSLFITASGAAQVYRYDLSPTGLVLYGIATLPEAFTDVGSLLVKGSWVYFTTYVSDGVIGRLHGTNSFCRTYCGPVGYCNSGVCACQTPYVLTLDEAGKFTCINPVVYEYITKEIANQAAATAFGVLFAFSLVAALAGWGMWWREKNGSGGGYQTL